MLLDKGNQFEQTNERGKIVKTKSSYKSIVINISKLFILLALVSLYNQLIVYQIDKVSWSVCVCL